MDIKNNYPNSTVKTDFNINTQKLSNLLEKPSNLAEKTPENLSTFNENLVSNIKQNTDQTKLTNEIKDLYNKLLEKLKNEIEEIKSTPVSQNLNPSLLRGLITSGLLSTIYMSSSPLLALIPILTTLISYKIGQKTENTIYPLASSFALPIIINSLILAYNSINPLSAISLLLTSSMISTTGLLNSTTSKEISDIKSFSLQTLPLNFLTKLPLSLNLVSLFSSSLSNIFDTNDKNKIIFSVLTNLALSAILALPFGVINFALFSALSSILSVANIKLAPKIQNVLDKVQNYLSNKISNFLKDRLGFLSRLPLKIRSLIGGTITGATASIPTLILSQILAPIIGPISLALPLAAFIFTTATTTKSLYNMIKLKEETLKTIQTIESLVEQNNIDKAIETFKNYIIQNNKNNNEIDFSKLDNNQIEKIMFNQLINYHLNNSILYYNDKKIQEAIKEFKYVQLLTIVMNTKDINKAKEIINNIPDEQILKIIENSFKVQEKPT